MLYVEKIRVGLDRISYINLLDDICLFRFYKKDSSPNINRFMNHFLDSFGPFFCESLHSNIPIVEEMLTKLYPSGNHRENARAILNTLNKEKSNFHFFNDNSNLEYFTFKISNENLSLFEDLFYNKSDFPTYSSFFREMILAYLSCPISTRQMMIFSKETSTIEEAITKGCKIKFDTLTSTNNIGTPISFSLGGERRSSYICVLNCSINNGKSFLKISFSSLSVIKNVKILNEKADIPNEKEKYAIERITANGAAFYPKETEKIIKVKMSPKAIDVFNKKKINRPCPLSIENDIYTFDCNYFQFQVYFSTLFLDCTILEPQDLIDAIVDNSQKIIDKYHK